MKLADLHPLVGRVANEADVFWLSFDCPRCGPPLRILINCHRAEPDVVRLVWQFEGALTMWEKMTLNPSIKCPAHGWYKCGWEGFIVRGEVTD